MQAALPPRGANFCRAILLTGLAGAGKTHLLDELSKLGEQVIDLEQLANHSGSVFGGLGRSPQPSHNIFQQLVWDAWLAADPEAPLWIEDEGPFIGSVGLPSWLTDMLPQLPVVEVESELAKRISRLAEQYGSIPQTDLEAALNRLDRRFDRSLVDSAIAAVRTGRLRDAIEIVLPYYDDAYRHRMVQHSRTILATHRPGIDDPRALVCSVRAALANSSAFTGAN